MSSFTVDAASAGQTLAAILRSHLSLPWSAARALCESGKLFVDEVRTLDSAMRPPAGAVLVVRQAAPRPLSERSVQALAAIVFEDSQVVVIDKPAGIISVPYERDDTNTAMDLIRAAWRAQLSEAHPDRARARGLPPEFIEVAEAKAAAINAAYDEIVRDRRAMTLDGAA